LADLQPFFFQTPITLSPEEQLQTPVRPDEEVVVLRRKVDTGLGEKDPVRKVKFAASPCIAAQLFP
jgi:hypothetical protein